MQTRRMFLSEMLAGVAAASCSRPEPVPSGRSPNLAPVTGASVSKGPPLKLTMAHFPVLCLVASRVALERGFFAAEGLDVDLLPGDLAREHEHATAVTWVVGPGGPVRADVTVIEYQTLIEIALGQLDYYVVAGEHSGCRQLIVPTDSRIQALADLKGKRVGIPPFNDSLMWEYLARQVGVTAASIRWVPVDVASGGSEELEFVEREFAASRLDAYIALDPLGEILKVKCTALLLASNTWTAPLNGWYCCVIAVRREVIDAHPEVPGAMTRAYRQSAAFIEQNPAEAVALSVAKGYMPRDTPQDLCARLLGEYVWTGTGRIEEDLERYFRLLIEAGRLPATTPPRELVRRVYRGVEA